MEAKFALKHFYSTFTLQLQLKIQLWLQNSNTLIMMVHFIKFGLNQHYQQKSLEQTLPMQLDRLYVWLMHQQHVPLATLILLLSKQPAPFQA